MFVSLVQMCDMFTTFVLPFEVNTNWRRFLHTGPNTYWTKHQDPMLTFFLPQTVCRVHCKNCDCSGSQIVCCDALGHCMALSGELRAACCPSKRLCHSRQWLENWPCGKRSSPQKLHTGKNPDAYALISLLLIEAAHYISVPGWQWFWELLCWCITLIGWIAFSLKCYWSKFLIVYLLRILVVTVLLAI